MSREHPIIAVTGSSGAGSSSITRAFEHIFRRERVKAVYIQGSAFHRYTRAEMQEELLRAKQEGRSLTHFGPEGNHLDKLESLLFQYAVTGTGVYRYYLHSKEHADAMGQEPGTFSPWKMMKKKSDLLYYRGLHGGAISDDIDIAQYADLLIGIVPNINLEWIRKIQRDTSMRGYTKAEVRQSIIDRMSDYVNHITPQFSRTHVNFQLVPAVDTSDPFNMPVYPTDSESLLIISFRDGTQVDFVRLKSMLPESFMSRRDTIVVPGGKLTHALEVVLMPMIHELVETSRKIRGIKKPPKKKKCGLIGMLGQSIG
ncbi:phosphoribulokinase [Solemya velum gill symbiont]|uniref:phosphoribulokinase n=2 Tax=Solemya velum gill symbiont TaxID=2340 RepID=A0A1T2HMM6_SOVGS|nr:phosphoribulokinase [Solemya velum gill symbiont]OOY36163.1 phosphoribulokinase [Solemya velum gill symbiont]OOY38130.1 phosphoribulokinase [Solemya velum gill symbiont]OOY39934.1 phosphoribulokinase [Solemya velum gill symbiont]OOY45158.1 phosphoribulokinase [Solemya velum gill symbiont]OOY48703.1 phosphoribulokinase [Solemya velum gill symbiont]